MGNNYDDIMRSKSTEELSQLIKNTYLQQSGQSVTSGLSPDGLKAAERELAKRQGAQDQKSSTHRDSNAEVSHQSIKPEKSESITEEKLVDKYPALRTISTVYAVFALIIALATIGVSIYLFGQNQILALAAVIIGALLVLGVLAFSESIKVVIDIEENTRRTAERLRK